MKPVLYRHYLTDSEHLAYVTSIQHEPRAFKGIVITSNNVFENSEIFDCTWNYEGEEEFDERFNLDVDLTQKHEDKKKAVTKDATLSASLSDYAIPLDFVKWIAEVMQKGGAKHGDDNWKQVDGKKSSHKEMHDSMFHHLSKSFSSEGDAIDYETGCNHLAHLATRALMSLYIKTYKLRG